MSSVCICHLSFLVGGARWDSNDKWDFIFGGDPDEMAIRSVA